MATLGSKVLGTLDNWVEDIIERLERLVVEKVRPPLRRWVEERIGEIEEARDSVVSPSQVEDARSIVKQFLTDPLPGLESLAGRAFRAFVGSALIVSQGLGLMQVTRTLGQYRVAREVTPGRLDPQTWAQLFHRWRNAGEQLRDDLKDQGWTDQRIDAFEFLARLWPAPAEYLAGWLRDPQRWDISENLTRLGYNVPSVELMKELASNRIPPIQDIIRMAVREAFTPEFVVQFEMDSGFETFPVEWAEKQGLSEFWSRNYWRAHWELPSLTQGFEMLHRKKIEDADIDLLLRAADVMPHFRDPLKQIAYRPFTRVDVRRMHRFGVLETDQELQTAYEDLGFDADKAAKMVEFTKDFNEEGDRELTKGEILKALRKMYITSGHAETLLQGIGYTQDQASFLVDTETFRAAEDARDLSLGQTKKAYLKLHKGRAWAFVELADLGYSSEAQTAMVDLWDLEQERPKRNPSKADLEAWLVGGLIPIQQYASEMVGLGYSLAHTVLYIRQAGGDPGSVAWVPIANEHGTTEPLP